MSSLDAIPSSPERMGWRSALLFGIAAGVIAILVVCMWAPYTLLSGMPYETTFPLTSETSSTWDGFFYADPLRRHTNTFYHLAYLIGRLCGIEGSFLPYQIVMAMLWWARGLLVWAILRRFLPTQEMVCLIAGALTVVHTADGATNWVGQINQHGFIFWMLFAAWLGVTAYRSSAPWTRLLLALSMAFCLHMSLWSYESQIAIVAVLPSALFFLRPVDLRRLLTLSGGWYAVVTVYMLQTIRRYVDAGSSTYQQSVMRDDLSLASVLSDWSVNTRYSLNITEWGGSLAAGFGGSSLVPCAAVAVLVLIAGTIAVIAVQRRNSTIKMSGRYLSSIALLCFGFALLISSYPVYLLLGSATTHWRTQFLSGIGAAFVFASGAALLSAWIPYRWCRGLALAACACPVVWLGVQNGIKLGDLHDRIWQQHRHAVSQVLHAAPRVKPNTLIILTDVPGPPDDRDPFGDNMWFDVALRLAYPETPVAGAYYYEGGGSPPGARFVLSGSTWRWDENGFPPVVREAGVEDSVVIRYTESGGQLLDHLPSVLVSESSRHVENEYRPEEAILPGPPDMRAARKYLISDAALRIE